MARMFKATVDRGAVLWTGSTNKRPIWNHYGKHPDEDVFFILKMTAPYARTQGCAFHSDAPVPFLRAMGIKVEERTNTFPKWKAIGCSYSEVRAPHFREDSYPIEPHVLQFYRECSKLSNVEMEVLLQPFEELAWTLGTIREGIGIIDPVPEEEGWLAL
jgi:hypothetical protein